MNIRELKLFHHLAQTLHFGRTSRECNITPSGLTRAIQRLEAEVGHSLFHRDNRTVHLTSAGLSFRSYCDEAIDNWNQLQFDLNGMATLKGELSLYCSVTAILTVLPTIFRQFKNEHPDIRIRIETGDAADAQAKIDNKEADISIIALPDIYGEKYQFIKFLQTSLIFIRPGTFQESIIYEDGEINWEKTPIIMPNKGLSRQRVDNWLQEKNIRPNIYSEVAGNEAIIAMVAMGCGAAVVPQLVLENSPLARDIETIKVHPQLRPLSVGACTAKKNLHSPIVQAFWQTASLYQQGAEGGK